MSDRADSDWESELRRFQAAQIVQLATLHGGFYGQYKRRLRRLLPGKREMARLVAALDDAGPLPVVIPIDPVVRERFLPGRLLRLPDDPDLLSFEKFAPAWSSATQIHFAGEFEASFSMVATALVEELKGESDANLKTVFDLLWRDRWFFTDAQGMAFMRAEMSEFDARSGSAQQAAEVAFEAAKTAVEAARCDSADLDDWLERVFLALPSIAYAQYLLAQMQDDRSARCLRMIDEYSADAKAVLLSAMSAVMNRAKTSWTAELHAELRDADNEELRKRMKRKIRFNSRARLHTPYWWAEEATQFVDDWPAKPAARLNAFDELKHAGRFIFAFSPLLEDSSLHELTRVALTGTDTELAVAFAQITPAEPLNSLPQVRMPGRGSPHTED